MMYKSLSYMSLFVDILKYQRWLHVATWKLSWCGFCLTCDLAHLSVGWQLSVEPKGTVEKKGAVKLGFSSSKKKWRIP